METLLCDYCRLNFPCHPFLTFPRAGMWGSAPLYRDERDPEMFHYALGKARVGAADF